MSERAPSVITQPLLAVAIAFPLLATVAVIIRFYARKIKSQSLRADDWMIVFSLVRAKVSLRHSMRVSY